MDNWCQGRPKTFLCVSLSFDSASAATAYIGVRNLSIRECVFLTYNPAENVPCLETGTEVLYGNRFTCALVHSWRRFRRRFQFVFTRSSFFSFCVRSIVSNVLNLLYSNVLKYIYIYIYIYIYTHTRMNIKDVSPTCFSTSVPSSASTTGHV